MDHIHFEHCVIPAILCPRLEKAFAMTIHKSQGSEFETVLALLPPGTKADRRLLYTAITRAKKKLILIGQQEALVQALHQKNERVSTLADRIKRKLIIIDAKRTA
jgi:exodeoxyribonuclease V alpha subunit